MLQIYDSLLPFSEWLKAYVLSREGSGCSCSSDHLPLLSLYHRGKLSRLPLCPGLSCEHSIKVHLYKFPMNLWFTGFLYFYSSPHLDLSSLLKLQLDSSYSFLLCSFSVLSKVSQCSDRISPQRHLFLLRFQVGLFPCEFSSRKSKESYDLYIGQSFLVSLREMSFSQLCTS